MPEIISPEIEIDLLLADFQAACEEVVLDEQHNNVPATVLVKHRAILRNALRQRLLGTPAARAPERRP